MDKKSKQISGLKSGEIIQKANKYFSEPEKTFYHPRIIINWMYKSSDMGKIYWSIRRTRTIITMDEAIRI